MVGSLPACCARTPSGHDTDAAVLAEQRDELAGASFDDLVGNGEQLVRNIDA
jgi:hypothetical protein